MVKKVIQKTKILYVLVALAVAVSALSGAASPVYADSNVNFQVNIKEVLKVSVSVPSAYASYDYDDADNTSGISDLLVNKITLGVSSNNANGFTATMHADNTKNTSGCTNASLAQNVLINCSKNASYIPTLTNSVSKTNFASNASYANYWGYSTDDTTYYAVPLSSNKLAIQEKYSDTKGTWSQDFYYAAKADVTQDSGVYENTIVFSVVSGVNSDNPSIVDPVTPSDDTPNDNKPTYDSGKDRTVYTYTTGTTNTLYPSTGTTPTTTVVEVSSGNTTTAYAAPQGVTTSNIGQGSPLAIGLAVTAAAAAGAGIIFFIIAKRRDKDEEEADNQQQQM